jgi:hypothetical protein
MNQSDARDAGHAAAVEAFAANRTGGGSKGAAAPLRQHMPNGAARSRGSVEI